MIHHVHEHIIEELKTNTKTDTIFVLSAIVLNLVMLGINTGIASAGAEAKNILLILIFAGLIITINVVSEIGLIKGRQTRTKLIKGLLAMYRDNQVDKYYDESLLKAYKTRYNLFMLSVLFSGIVSIIVPFVII